MTLRTTLGVDGLDGRVTHGATMTLAQAVSYARSEIRAALGEAADPE